MKHALLSAYRFRGPLYYVAATVLIGYAVVGRHLGGGIAAIAGVVVAVALGVAVACVALTLIGPRLLPEHQPRLVLPPVRGRWLALNSPATKVPSHGVRAYGQAYAIDLCHDPVDRERPQFGGTALRRSDAYPGFGEPVYAMVDGVVVRVVAGLRDHRARSNLLGIALMMLEGVVREIGGPRFILGNHVVMETEDGAFAATAHLQRQSVTVRVGDRVRAGEMIGRCGNSGNSSEPHVHAQLMDRASPWTGQGLPISFAAIRVGDRAESIDGVPANQEHLDTTATPS